MMGAGKARTVDTVGTEWLKDVLRSLAFAPSFLAHRAPNATKPRPGRTIREHACFLRVAFDIRDGLLGAQRGLEHLIVARRQREMNPTPTELIMRRQQTDNCRQRILSFDVNWNHHLQSVTDLPHVVMQTHPL